MCCAKYSPIKMKYPKIYQLSAHSTITVRGGYRWIGPESLYSTERVNSRLHICSSLSLVLAGHHLAISLHWAIIGNMRMTEIIFFFLYIQVK